MLEIKNTLLSDVSPSLVTALCKIKDMHWPHGLDSQLDWWHRNSDADDRLVALFENGAPVAFLRIRNRVVTVNGHELTAACATEVSVSTGAQGRGFGCLMLDAVAQFVRNGQAELGYLLCEHKQKAFYERCGWKPVADVEIMDSSGVVRPLRDHEFCMICNPEGDGVDGLTLYGDVF
ncbi:GNAT family N-acetyltransferase [Aestuariispira insulae]|uniref:Acetyltransferase (GNAT) family protein n=1 Tax=Aestuariispira insulae TaxID=1461337 RepID=A0A3D9H5R7_9PROT|nr:GNAT family N-acetyltransferase [Aestuariispira insulae]RED44306.1 acetyltransferase (GNAT) family protein [Aestuariispira insulae]